MAVGEKKDMWLTILILIIILVLGTLWLEYAEKS